jgi:hypothetical protein
MTGRRNGLAPWAMAGTSGKPPDVGQHKACTHEHNTYSTVAAIHQWRPTHSLQRGSYRGCRRASMSNPVPRYVGARDGPS